ncbi:T9SS type A sorting domain-containing protein [Plebeiibacterium marinum]|uniref:T9SS type A sorting domain-containing protein n=1 Tax=Plebeiibacterium marinum TaxID=2992111 RepID=A0AAE3SKP7_9BACT|nr:T9SS type A sorting domain-containing protein [Plebeiobacterium marinum]MCW3806738.1 T9SS type A sorting domain-containing protein [Plebeiobacterium marinum]
MKKALLLIFVWSVISNFLFAQSWVQLTSADLEVPFPETLVKHQTDWYLGTPGGVFKLTNGSDSWVLVNNNLNNVIGQLRVEGMVSSGNNLVVVNRWYGIVYSANGGSSWVASSGLDGFYYLSRNIVSIGGRLLVVAEINDGTEAYVYYSDDNGTSWEQGMQVTGIDYEPDIFTDGTFAYITHSNTNNTGEFLSKTSNGQAAVSLGFSAAYPGSSIENTTIESLVKSGDYLIVGGEGSLYRYDQVGSEGWTNIGIPPYWENGIVFNNLCENGLGEVFATFLEGDMSVGFYSTLNQGDSWTLHTTSLTKGAPFALAFDAVGNEVIACFIDDGIHYTPDISTTAVSPLNSGLLASDFQELYVSGDNMLTSLFVSGIYGSSDLGSSWNVWMNGFPAEQQLERVYGYLNNGAYLFANYSNNPDDDPEPQDLYRSVDDGENWEKVNYPATIDNVKVVGKNGSVIFGMALDGSDIRYYRSLNNGDAWTEATTIPADFVPKVISGDGVSGENNLLFMAGVNTSNLLEVYKSSDDGETWALAMDGISTGSLEALYDDEDVLLITPAGKAFLKVRYSNWNYRLLSWETNTWVQKYSGDLPYYDFSAMAYHDGVLFVSPYDQGIYLSYNDGDSYISTSGISAGVEVYDFAFYNGVAYTTTAQGIWQLTIPTNLDDSELYDGAVLSPNPASDIVNLNIEANKVSIYSLTGDLIHVYNVVDNAINVSDLKNGIYIVLVEGNSRSKVVKLIKK